MYIYIYKYNFHFLYQHVDVNNSTGRHVLRAGIEQIDINMDVHIYT